VVASENRALEFALLLTLPAAVALFLAAHPMVRVLFEHGAFTAIDGVATASMLSVFAFGLPAFVLVKVLHPSFFAREDTKTPMLLAGIAMAANLMLALLLFLLLGAVGIALATTLSGWLHAGLLAAVLRQRGEFSLDATFRRRFVGIVGASLVMAVALSGLLSLLQSWFDRASGVILQGTALLLVVTGGLLVYLAAAHLLGAAKFRDILKSAGA
jgi:putative peptidoglycan lipid II flippase